MSAPKTAREISFEEIEREWHLATWALSPAVGRLRDEHGGYYIRVVNTRPGSPKFDDFETTADGMIVRAPRGFTKDYKGSRIAGLDSAVEKYKQVHREMHPRYSRAASTYLVWSNEGRSWWRANGSGYTGDVWTAGRFDETEARKACGMRTWSKGTPPPEVMVLAPEDGRDAFTVDDIRAVPDLMRQRIDEATREAIAERVAGAS